jgi:hypothetical protein
VQVILHYLGERNWLERNGAIIFSQYRTTAEWVLEALCATYPDEPVALYAGGTASFGQKPGRPMGCAMFRVGTRSSMKQASNFVYVGNITLRGPLGCHKNATHKEQLQLSGLSCLLERRS